MYVSRVDQTSVKAELNMDSLEHFVDLVVAAAPRPPAFDDTSVVSVDLESRTWGGVSENGSNKEFHADGLCPADVPLICVPAWS